MMTPEGDIPTASYGLLASGANFSCEVLQALQQQLYMPELVILPEYPPAQRVPAANREIMSTTPQRCFLEQARGVDIAYAPASEQANCARLVKQHAIDFLLVACWPYLIDKVLIDSARKGALNMHPSLLPDFRGPNPVAQQLACRHAVFGVSLHLLSRQFDRGDIVAQAELRDPGNSPDRFRLEHRCAVLGAELFIAATRQYDQGWQPVRQAV